MIIRRAEAINTLLLGHVRSRRTGERKKERKTDLVARKYEIYSWTILVSVWQVTQRGMVDRDLDLGYALHCASSRMTKYSQ